MTNHPDYAHQLKEHGTIEVPPTFWDDHVSRDLTNDPATGEVEPLEVGRTKRAVRIIARPDVLAELESDARHYSADYDPEFLGLMASARATVKRIERHRAAQAVDA